MNLGKDSKPTPDKPTPHDLAHWYGHRPAHVKTHRLDFADLSKLRLQSNAHVVIDPRPEWAGLALVASDSLQALDQLKLERTDSTLRIEAPPSVVVQNKGGRVTISNATNVVMGSIRVSGSLVVGDSNITVNGKPLSELEATVSEPVLVVLGMTTVPTLRV